MSAHSENGASLKLTTVKKGKSVKIHSNLQICCTRCIAEVLYFLFFVTGVDVVSQYFHNSMSNMSHLPGVYQGIER